MLSVKTSITNAATFRSISDSIRVENACAAASLNHVLATIKASATRRDREVFNRSVAQTSDRVRSVRRRMTRPRLSISSSLR